MAAGIAHGESYPTDNQQIPPYIETGAVIPLPRRSPESNLDPKEREMLQAFYNFANSNNNLDPTASSAEQMPGLSMAAHDFLADVGERHIERTGKQGSQFVMPKGPVNQRIKEHYRNYGTRRRTKSDEMLAIEEESLASKKRPLEADIYDDDLDGSDQDAPITKISTLAARYPEVIVGIKLEEALRKAGHQVAADSVEVVLAAYGSRLGELRAGEIARRGIIRVASNGNSLIKHPATGDLPEEAQAERYRPKPQ